MINNLSYYDKYTFKNFVVYKGNRLANKFAYLLANSYLENRSVILNPLLICGGSGVGKTHLLLAIGNYILAKKPNSKILYTTYDKVTGDYVNAVVEGKTNHFISSTNKYDVILIEDIDLQLGKLKTWQEFLSLCKIIIDQGKVVVMTSHMLTSQLTAPNPLDLPFEYESINIQPPIVNDKKAIIKLKADEHGMEIDENTINFLAQSHITDIRILEGLLNKLAAHQKIMRQPITESLCKCLIEKQ